MIGMYRLDGGDYMDLGAGGSDEAIEFESLCVSLPTKTPWEAPALGKSLGRCQWPRCHCILASTVCHDLIWQVCSHGRGSHLGEKMWEEQLPVSSCHSDPRLWCCQDALEIRRFSVSATVRPSKTRPGPAFNARRRIPVHKGNSATSWRDRSTLNFAISMTYFKEQRAPTPRCTNVIYNIRCSEVNSNRIVNEVVQLCEVSFYCHFRSLQFLAFRNMSISSFPVPFIPVYLFAVFCPNPKATICLKLP